MLLNVTIDYKDKLLQEMYTNDLELFTFINGDVIKAYYFGFLIGLVCEQFKEDGLRRRAIEVLINTLLEKNLIHFEFERRTKKEFSRYIWEKFDRRCFKCGPDSNPIALEEMALDHTMPLAYLYRLD